MKAAPSAGPWQRALGGALGLLLCGVAVVAGVRFHEGEGALFLAGACGCGLLGLEALVAAATGREALVLRLGPLP